MPQTFRLILAPMQGVLDPLMRQILTQVNNYDYCVSEFVRVVDQLLPAKAFYRLCPELYHEGKTLSGTPVRVQLLGQSPQWLAENAVRAVNLGSNGIDLNCGCPSKTVNNSQGGAALLKQPELIYQATQALRKALDISQVVSVKVRLGWDSSEQAYEIVDAVQQGGATEIAIHARTKQDGYRADRINWEKINELRKKLTIPVIANGEIWNKEDAIKCQLASGCQDLMVARGALTIPNLSHLIKGTETALSWFQVLQLIEQYIITDNHTDCRFYYLSRIKQWLRYLSDYYIEAEELFQTIKILQSYDQLYQVIKKELTLYN